jgi:hypothetical protein
VNGCASWRVVGWMLRHERLERAATPSVATA